MTSEFGMFLERLREEIGGLTHRHQLAFAAACCERALPRYASFSRKESWGEVKPLRQAIDQVWRYVEGEDIDMGRISELKADCNRLVPDLDSFGSAEAAAAQDAALSVLVLLEYCVNPDPRHAVRIASFARDTADMYVQLQKELDAGDPQLEEKIAQDPVTKAELTRLETDVSDLKSEPHLTREFLDHFRARALTQGG